MLFWLVNKNNPVLPFLTFGLIGSWLGMVLEAKLPRRQPFWLGMTSLAVGVAAYIVLPDTMLQRAIDLKWYSIELAELGLFVLLILGSLALFDKDDNTGSRCRRWCRAIEFPNHPTAVVGAAESHS
jgi:hypothetical protein